MHCLGLFILSLCVLMSVAFSPAYWLSETPPPYQNLLNTANQQYVPQQQQGYVALQTVQPPVKQTTAAPPPPTIGAHGCYYKGVWYNKLTEISKGQSGDWCYGSYCNHKGEVIFWDDYNCPLQQKATTPAPPVQTTAGFGYDTSGCWYHGRWYAAGSDIENYSDYYVCSGVYCDWSSKVVHWEDSCHNTVPPMPAVPTPKPDIYRR